VKLVFLGTAEFAVPSLEAVVRAGHDVALVVTQPDRPRGRSGRPEPPPVKVAAGRPGLPVAQPEEKLKESPVARRMLEIAPDAAVVVAYGKWIPNVLLGVPRLGFLNVHGSLLPKYRGAAPVQWAVASGETETGVTIIRLTDRLDAGPVLARRAVAIGERETAAGVLARLGPVGADLLVETLAALEAGRAREEAQDEAAATYAPVLAKEDGLVDWGRPAREIAWRVRGFTPWPGAHGRLERAKGPLRVELVEAREASAPLPRPAAPGEVLGAAEDGLLVAAGEGTGLVVLRLKPEGKREMAADEFLRGRGVAPGDRFAPPAPQAAAS